MATRGGLVFMRCIYSIAYEFELLDDGHDKLDRYFVSISFGYRLKCTKSSLDDDTLRCLFLCS